MLCLVFLSCLTVIPWAVALQAPLSMGILQARTLEWVAMSSSRGSSQPRDPTKVSHIAGRFFTSEPPESPYIFRLPAPCCKLLYNLTPPSTSWETVLSESVEILSPRLEFLRISPSKATLYFQVVSILLVDTSDLDSSL